MVKPSRGPAPIKHRQVPREGLAMLKTLSRERRQFVQIMLA